MTDAQKSEIERLMLLKPKKPAPTPFQVLNVSLEVTHAEFKKAYRKLSILVHPDKCSHPLADDAFHFLDKSYKMVGDSEPMFDRFKTLAKRVAEKEADKKRPRDVSAATGGPQATESGVTGRLTREELIKKAMEERALEAERKAEEMAEKRKRMEQQAQQKAAEKKTVAAQQAAFDELKDMF